MNTGDAFQNAKHLFIENFFTSAVKIFLFVWNKPPYNSFCTLLYDTVLERVQKYKPEIFLAAIVSADLVEYLTT